MSKLTEWLWEGNGDPDDDVREAERLTREFVGGGVDVQGMLIVADNGSLN